MKTLYLHVFLNFCNFLLALFSFSVQNEILRTFAQNFPNIDFFLKILPLKDDELALSEM